jgi:hypothetical protein
METINTLEDKIYDFVGGVLPTLVDTKEGGFGYTVRFKGYTLQKDPITVDLFKRNQCWITAEGSRVMYQYPIGDDGAVEQEVELTYGITLASKYTNSLLSTAGTWAFKLLAHRDGYELFDVAGISKFAITSQHVEPYKNSSVLFVDMILRLRAVITLSDIKTRGHAKYGKVTIFDNDKKVSEIDV